MISTPVTRWLCTQPAWVHPYAAFLVGLLPYQLHLPAIAAGIITWTRTEDTLFWVVPWRALGAVLLRTESSIAAPIYHYLLHAAVYVWLCAGPELVGAPFTTLREYLVVRVPIEALQMVSLLVIHAQGYANLGLSPLQRAIERILIGAAVFLLKLWWTRVRGGSGSIASVRVASSAAPAMRMLPLDPPAEAPDRLDGGGKHATSEADADASLTHGCASSGACSSATAIGPFGVLGSCDDATNAAGLGGISSAKLDMSSGGVSVIGNSLPLSFGAERISGCSVLMAAAADTVATASLAAPTCLVKALWGGGPALTHAADVAVPEQACTPPMPPAALPAAAVALPAAQSTTMLALLQSGAGAGAGVESAEGARMAADSLRTYTKRLMSTRPVFAPSRTRVCVSIKIPDAEPENLVPGWKQILAGHVARAHVGGGVNSNLFRGGGANVVCGGGGGDVDGARLVAAYVMRGCTQLILDISVDAAAAVAAALGSRRAGGGGGGGGGGGPDVLGRTSSIEFIGGASSAATHMYALSQAQQAWLGECLFNADVMQGCPLVGTMQLRGGLLPGWCGECVAPHPGSLHAVCVPGVALAPGSSDVVHLSPAAKTQQVSPTREEGGSTAANEALPQLLSLPLRLSGRLPPGTGLHARLSGAFVPIVRLLCAACLESVDECACKGAFSGGSSSQHMLEPLALGGPVDLDHAHDTTEGAAQLPSSCHAGTLLSALLHALPTTIVGDADDDASAAMTHLHLAVASGCPAVVAALAAAARAHGAALDWAVPGGGGVTPLHLAAMLPGGCALLTGGGDAGARVATAWLSTHDSNKGTPDMLHAHARTEASSLEFPATPEDALSLFASDAESKEGGGRPDGASEATAAAAAAIIVTGSVAESATDAADTAHFASLLTPPQQPAGLLHVPRQARPRRSSDLGAQGLPPLRSPQQASAPPLSDSSRHGRCETPKPGALTATPGTVCPCPVITAADADAAAEWPPYNRPPPLWCRAGFIIATVKVAGFIIEDVMTAFPCADQTRLW
ncbi:hypothetical protein FOA52_004000 [Chlamydomonas sp. UWO 241]|nr:hypothetical protein FOA52_004000 [Chlamydomonas sp. UWO 241]